MQWTLSIALIFGLLLGLIVFGGAFSSQSQAEAPVIEKAAEYPFPLKKTNEDWKKELSASQYYILREKGTELPFFNTYHDNKKSGTYYGAACHKELFQSEHQYHSGTGWPSFYQAANPKAVLNREDNSLGMTRTEVLCSHCGGHLGHVFKDGPDPTGLRYCINSAALSFEEEQMANRP